MVKKIGLSCLILLIVICCCSIILLIPGVWIGMDQNKKNTSQPTLQNRPIMTTEKVTISPKPVLDAATPKAASTQTPSSNVPEDMQAQMDRIQNQVSKIRGLDLKKPFTRGILTPQELRKKVTDDFFADYTPEKAAEDVLIYSLLGLIDPETDLLTLYKDLYSEQIAGFYDQETKEMFVVQDDAFDGMEKMNYAHEFTHTLQDQQYDLQDGLKINDDYCKSNSEYCAAVTALVEGDAFSTEQDWLYTNGTSQDRAQIQDFSMNMSSPVYDSSPDFIKDDLLFPYQKGYEFVQTLFTKGGWNAVDQAYQNPPITTEQILHPDLYPNEKPVKVEITDLSKTLGSTWRVVNQGTLGELYTQLILAKGWKTKIRLTENEAWQAAAGWGGDSYILYGKKDDLKSYLLVVEWKWDSHQDAEEFWKAFLKLNKIRWGNPVQETGLEVKWELKSGEEILIQYTSQGTRWVISSDANIYESVRPKLK